MTKHFSIIPKFTPMESVFIQLSVNVLISILKNQSGFVVQGHILVFDTNLQSVLLISGIYLFTFFLLYFLSKVCVFVICVPLQEHGEPKWQLNCRPHTLLTAENWWQYNYESVIMFVCACFFPFSLIFPSIRWALLKQEAAM